MNDHPHELMDLTVGLASDRIHYFEEAFPTVDVTRLHRGIDRHILRGKHRTWKLKVPRHEDREEAEPLPPSKRHTTLASIYAGVGASHLDRDERLERAREHLRAARELDPGNPEIGQVRSFYDL